VFESLTDKLQQVFRRLTSKGRLSERDVEEACRELRLVLLEADVNYKVVKDFVARIKERAVGQEVMQSLTPGQQVVKIVNEEMVALLGGEEVSIAFASKPPTTIMLAGLQGSGKTTTAGKLGNLFRGQGHRPLLVATDIYRPAAIRQLEVVGEQLELPVFPASTEQKPVAIARESLKQAAKDGQDLVILDTAGRLHIDQEMMAELVKMKQAISPQEILLVLDAMTGQDAVNSATEFDQALGITGFILAKLDGDARGGAALSVRAVTGKPIKFVGVGEKLDALEAFHPDRMASRILGMGDVLSLIEKAEATFDEEQTEELERKLRRDEFGLDDFLEQIQQVTKLGPLDQLLDMIPGLGALKKKGPVEVDPARLAQMEAIIKSMTKEERRHPGMIDGSRKRRIARGSGTRVQMVNQLLSQFKQMKAMFAQLTGMERSGGKMPDFPFPIQR